MEKHDKCYFCDATLINCSRSLEVSLCNCPNCGVYEIKNTLIHHFLNNGDLLKRRLVAGFLYETKVGYHDDGEFNRNLLSIDDQKFLQIIESPIVPKTISEKLIKILSYLDTTSSYFGEVIMVSQQAGYSINEHEFQSMMTALASEGLVNGPSFLDSKKDGGKTYNGYSLSLSGVERIHKYRTEEAVDQCFVAMQFCPESDDLFDKTIQPACLAAGYNAIKADKIKHTNYITNEILANIRRSKFMIADFTFQNRGVYYEAGFALGLGKKVIQLCRKDHFNRGIIKGDDTPKNEYYMHFDNAQINTIQWNAGEENDLKGTITDWVEALFGHGSYKNTSQS